MTLISHLGDKYGRHCFGSPSVRGHHRPAHYDFGSDFHQRDVRLDYVGPKVGASDHPSHIHSFQLPSSESQRKDIK